MPQIFAANNLTVTFDEDDWRLYNGQTDGAPPIVQAKPNGLTYQLAFATARRLDPGGHLATADISTVVVGWAEEDTSWHLGLLLTPEISRSRGGRWCGVARWNTPGSTDAERAGSALASTLDVPFRFVPPADMTAASTALANGAAPAMVGTGATGTAAASQAVGLYSDTTGGTPAGDATLLPSAPPVPAVLPLPIEIGDWLLRADSRGLVWQRTPAWRRKTLIYTVIGLVLGLLFGLLSLGAKLTQFAPVQPDWLPLVGMAIAVLMLIVAVVEGVTLLTAVSVVIDTADRFVRLMQGTGRINFQIPYEGIEYVLASHILSRHEIAGETGGFTYEHVWPDVWLHLFSPRRGFILVGDMTPTEGRTLAGVSFAERHPLNLAEIDTPAHHAALIIAQTIGVPVYVEARRSKDAANG